MEKKKRTLTPEQKEANRIRAKRWRAEHKELNDLQKIRQAQRICDKHPEYGYKVIECPSTVMSKGV